MKNERLKQSAASFFIILSLVASSFAAVCRCESHEPQESENSHCAAQTSKHSAHNHSHENSTVTVSVSLSENESCCCAESAPRIFAKTESVKIEKQTAIISPAPSPIEGVLISPSVSAKPVHRVVPFYLSHSFHNLSPGRAPPRP